MRISWFFQKIKFQSNHHLNFHSFCTNLGNINKTSMDMVEPTNTGLSEAKNQLRLWPLVWPSQTLFSTLTKATDCTLPSELKVWPRHLSENSSPWILEPGRYALKIRFCFNFQTGGGTLNFPIVPEGQCRISGIVWSKLDIFMRKGNRYYLFPFRFFSAFLETIFWSNIWPNIWP